MNYEHKLTIKETCSRKNWKVRTDLDEIYKAYTTLSLNGDISSFVSQFKKDIEDYNYKYTFFPLTLGVHPNNHWILFIMESNIIPSGSWRWYNVFFVSSSSSHLERFKEKTNIKNFVRKICDYDPTIYDIIPSVTQLNEYDCGVYLIKYIEYLLNEENISRSLMKNIKITQQDIIDFREKWKKRIGEDLWGKEIPTKKPVNQTPDEKWLTDDNIEYILNNYEVENDL